MCGFEPAGLAGFLQLGHPPAQPCVEKEETMAGRRSHVFDVQEMIRRFRLGQGDSEIARDLMADRGTVAKYREISKAEGWLGEAPAPTPDVTTGLTRTRFPARNGTTSFLILLLVPQGQNHRFVSFRCHSCGVPIRPAGASVFAGKWDRF
jgi:hypothetical protein